MSAALISISMCECWQHRNHDDDGTSSVRGTTHKYIFKLKMVDYWMPFTRNLFVSSCHSVLFLRSLHTVALYGASRRYAQRHLALSLWSLRQMHSLANERVFCSLYCHLACCGFATPFISPNSHSLSCRMTLFSHQHLFYVFYVCLSTTDQIKVQKTKRSLSLCSKIKYSANCIHFKCCQSAHLCFSSSISFQLSLLFATFVFK